MNAILPCAGFGIRMGMNPHQSKEMIIDPATNQHIIDYSLTLCKKYNLNPIIITRPEKKDLIEYIKDKAEIVLHDGSGEWPTSVLKAPRADDGNILILPDTKFEPENIIENIKTQLKLGCNSVVGIHRVEDVSKWGEVRDYTITEKPKRYHAGWAWGIIGYQAHYTDELFYGIKQDGYIELSKSSFIILDHFKDITRTGKIE